MTIDWLGLSVATFIISLVVALFGIALDVTEYRTRRRHVGVPLSKPEQRAEALLKEWLCPEQRATLNRYGYFEVTGSHSGKCYRIRRGRNMNIEELHDDGAQAAVWCFRPVGHLPLGDVMLAQKLALETNEQAALAVANRARWLSPFS